MGLTPIVQASHDRTRWVFLVQGRDHAATAAITGLLESVGLRVLQWEQAIQYAIKRTGDGSPYIGDILTEGMSRCHAVVVLFTPDDIGTLHPSLAGPDGVDEQLSGRARQNVVFEAGIAVGRAAPTVFVEFGHVAGFSDIAGRHAVRLDDSPKQRKALLDRLDVLGCDVDLTGSRWMEAGDLAGALTTLEAYRLVPVGDKVTIAPEPWAQPGHLVSSPVTQWFPTGGGGPHPTDLIVASVIQVPAGPGISHDPKGQLATIIRGEQREDQLAMLLDDSPVTHWLEHIAPSFQIALPLQRWAVTGHNTREWSELALELPGPDGLPPLISVNSKTNTGWIFDGQERLPGLVMFTELRFRLLELNANRRPDTIRHETTPAPAPGALSLDETFDALVAALRVANTAAAAYTALTGATAGTGQAALWLAASGGPIDRVLDVREFRLIPGSSGVGEQSTKVPLSFAAQTGQLVNEPAIRRASVQLLSELLERSGRRGTGERLARLERRPG